MALADPEELIPFADSLRRLLSGWRHDAAPRLGAEQIALWREMCAAGWGGLGAAPENVPLLALAMRETGGMGLPVPLIGAVAAQRWLGDADGAAGLLTGVADGSVRFALAMGPQDGDGGAGHADWAEGCLSGTLALVEDAEIATHLLVLTGQTQACVVALAQDNTRARVHITPTPGFATPPLAQVVLDRCPAQSWPITPARAAQMADLARVMLIARAHGAAERALALAVDYAGIRQQFGQLIGTFQAISHTLADCRLRGDLAQVLLDDAVIAFADEGDTARATANLVSVAAPALRRNGVEVQHVLGAVGFAAEHEAARHFTRIHADTARMGATRRARGWLAAQLASAQDRLAVFPPGPEPEAICALRGQVRAWLAENWGPEIRANPARGKDADFPFNRALAAKGWLTANWPKAQGGPGFDAFEQFAFLEEMRLGHAPMTLISPSYWIVGPSLIAAGSAPLQAALLPGMAAGDISFALGYSEPQAGSDLAALATRAVRDGEDYVITGQKIWTSNTEYASHIFLAARTGGDPITDKHNGITVFVVPINAPGVTVTRMNTLMHKSYAVVFLDDVRVPAAMMVGQEGGGWKVLSAALGAERIIMGGQIASLRGFFADLVLEMQGRGQAAIDPVLWDRLAELAAELEAARALSLRSVRLVAQGQSAIVEAAIAKLYSGELAERLGEVVLDLCGGAAGLNAGAAGALLGGAASQHLRTALMLSIGGGTAQVQRNTIAQRGLKLPR